MHLQVYIFPVIYSPFLIPPPPKLSEFHARGGRGLRRVAAEMHSPPGYRKRRTSSEQSAKGPGGRLHQSKAGKCGLPGASPEQSGKAPAPGDFPRAKRESAGPPTSSKQSTKANRARRTSPEQSAKGDHTTGTSPEQSGEASPGDFPRAKRESPPQDFARAKRESVARRALSQSKAEKRPRATFPEQSAKARHTAFAEQSGEVWPPRPPGGFRKAKRERGRRALSHWKVWKFSGHPPGPGGQPKGKRKGGRPR